MNNIVSNILSDFIKGKYKQKEKIRMKLNLLYEKVNTIYSIGNIACLSLNEIQSQYFPDLTTTDIRKIISRDHRFYIGINPNLTLKEEYIYSQKMFNEHGYYDEEYGKSHFSF